MKVETFVLRTGKDTEKWAGEHMVGLKFDPSKKIDCHAQCRFERSAFREKRFDDFVDFLYRCTHAERLALDVKELFGLFTNLLPDCLSELSGEPQAISQFGDACDGGLPGLGLLHRFFGNEPTRLCR